MNPIGRRQPHNPCQHDGDEVPLECRIAALAAGAFLCYDPGCLSVTTVALVVGTHAYRKVVENDNPHLLPPTRFGMD